MTVNNIIYPDAMIKTLIGVLILEQFYLYCYITCLDYCQLMVMILTEDEQILILILLKAEGREIVKHSATDGCLYHPCSLALCGYYTHK